jgi:hypothetical protein
MKTPVGLKFLNITGYYVYTLLREVLFYYAVFTKMWLVLSKGSLFKKKNH